MIIDVHTHIFPDNLAPSAIANLMAFAPLMQNHTDGTSSGLIGSMKQAGISTCVVLPVATKPSQVETINTIAGQKNPPGLIFFGSLHPDYADLSIEIDRLKSLGVRGVKLHPLYQNFAIDDRRVFPMYEQLADAGLIVTFHTGEDVAPLPADLALPDAVARVVAAIPSLTIIAAHMGGWRRWDQVLRDLAGASVFFDTAALPGVCPPEIFIELVQKHGSDRILFGSDSPWWGQRESVEWIDKMALSSMDKERIFYANARSLLSIG